MGRHREWRKIAKRERRRRIRTLQAKFRDDLLYPQHDKMWFQEQNTLEQFEYEQIKMSNMTENLKWIEAEKIAMEQWNILQRRKEQLHHKHLEKQAKLKLEWEMEQKRIELEEERLKKIEEERKKRQELLISQLENFLIGDLEKPPAELVISHETRPDAELCPFFSKTASCRFGDECSRNHRYPGISKILVAPNFFVHFGINNANFNEYDTDLMLEYEENDTYKEFIEFFNDVTPEFKKFGKIVQFKVCHNYEKHLRGNTYVEFSDLRCAVAAYQALHGRWYGGRQLSLQFCNIISWAKAICGLAVGKRCPKGRACNFLHVFMNPKNLYNGRIESKRSPNRSRNWRWSESPETDIRRRRRSKSFNRSRERERSSRHKRRHRSRSKDRSH